MIPGEPRDSCPPPISSYSAANDNDLLRTRDVRPGDAHRFRRRAQVHDGDHSLHDGTNACGYLLGYG